MKQVRGIWWPDFASEKNIRYSERSVQWIEWAIGQCGQRRTAVQAGGNIGLWPRRLAQSFNKVITFEPDDLSRECLVMNVPKNVSVFSDAIGPEYSRCRIKHRSIGAARVFPGDGVSMVPLDSLHLSDCDLIAFDLEGYEFNALLGAADTINRCGPIIQVEVRGEEEKYGHTERDVRQFLSGHGYKEVSRQPGPDVVFAR